MEIANLKMFRCKCEFDFYGGRILFGQVFIVNSELSLECPVKDYYDFDDYWEEVKGVLK